MKNRKKIIINISSLLTVIVIIALGSKAIEVHKIIKQLDTQIVQTQKNLNKDKQIFQDLEEEKKLMNSLPYIEKIAREKLGMVKPEDVVFKEKPNAN